MIELPTGTGTNFVGYRIEDMIGRGGMGVVYRAHDLRLKRTVALKLIAPELALDERFRERFARETELAMSLEHPNVVPIYDAGDVDGRLYLAMRLVVGTDLRKLLNSERALEPARTLAVCRQVASALDAAHAKGLVHRDVKPSNVLLDENEHVYLADFGLTRRLDEQVILVTDNRSLGTPAYLAPEQIEGGSIDGRADIYSLGCLLYECLTGETPFAPGSRLAVAWAHLEKEPPSAFERRPELPEAIDAVIRTAMAKKPEDRYPTCAALITAAEEALGLRPRPALRRHRLWVVAAVAAVVFLAAMLVAAGLIRSTGGAAGPAVKADTLVRIDPETNKVNSVVDVGLYPSATAVGGRTVWVLNAGPSVTEIDAATGTVRHTTKLLDAAPSHPDVFSGPVLAADTAGAWVVGIDYHDRPRLWRVFSGPRGKREYPLENKPLAVAVGNGAVWVVTRGFGDHQLLRIEPATGKVTGRTRFPASAPVDSLAAGLGSVWVVASHPAVLYRVEPRSGRIAGRIDLGEHAARPEVVLGSIWVGLSYGTIVINPRPLRVVTNLDCCDPERGYFTGGHGSIWTYDTPTGTVTRHDGQTHQDTAVIHLTDAPYNGGLCLTSIAAGARAIWVTVTPNTYYEC